MFRASKTLVVITGLMVGEAEGNIAKRAIRMSDTMCVSSFDVFLIQDVSETFMSDLGSAVDLMGSWIDSVQATYPESRFGYATFTDKPIPYSGFGAYGGWQNQNIQSDWCFALEQPLINNKNVFTTALEAVWKKTGSGFDWKESQLEAVLRATVNKNAGWNAEDEKVISTLLLITDVVSHLPGDAKANIDAYNRPRSLVNAAKFETGGGWGSHEIGNSDIIPSWKRGEYFEMAGLLGRRDYYPFGLNGEQQARLEELEKYYGPETFPEVIPHPGDDSLPCDVVEYPEPRVVAKALKAMGIVPVVLVIDGGDENCGGSQLEELENCPQTFYKRWMEMNDLNGIVRPFPQHNKDEAVQTLIDAVAAVSAIFCETSTPVPSTPVPSTPVPSTPVPSTPVPSTPVPTTPVPSTPVPSTPVPSTPVPSTPVPSTPVPSTPVQSTRVKSTPVPSTIVPSTLVPSTLVPSTPVPSTPVPSTPVPSTPVQSTRVKSTPVPSTLAPSTPVPSTLVPSTLAASTLVPSTPTAVPVITTSLLPISPTTMADTTAAFSPFATTSIAAPTTTVSSTYLITTLPTKLPPTTATSTTRTATEANPTSASDDASTSTTAGGGAFPVAPVVGAAAGVVGVAGVAGVVAAVQGGAFGTFGGGEGVLSEAQGFDQETLREAVQPAHMEMFA